MRSKVIDSVNILIGFVIGAREEADSAFNQGEFIAVGVQFGRVKNGMSEVVDERVIGIVSFGAVDDDSLEILVPRLRFAEKFAQVMFAFNGVKSEAFNELFGNVFVNVVGIGVTKIILKSNPDVIAKLFLKFFHFEGLQK